MGQEFVVAGYFPGPDGFDSIFAARSALAVEVTDDAGLPIRESARDNAITVWQRTQRVVKERSDD